MPEFLELLPPMQAIQLLFDNLPPSTLRSELIETTKAAGRVIYEDILSPESLPAFPRSTVDGFAVQASSTYGASENLPAYVKIIGECPMGDKPSFAVQANEAAIIHTGGMLPEGADSVVMLEYTQTLKSGDLEVMRPVANGENIIEVGEDVKIGNIVIPAHQTVRAAELGGLLSLGLNQIKVASKPIIGIISSGDEVIAPDLAPRSTPGAGPAPTSAPGWRPARCAPGLAPRRRSCGRCAGNGPAPAPRPPPGPNSAAAAAP